MSEGGSAEINNSPVKVGQVIAGKYRIERVIGEGGMGIVVAAHHVQLDERVAIKFLLPGATSSSELMARFLREARAAVKIKSEHIARVLDVSQLEDGMPYMVMEYLEGKDLAALIEAEGRLSVEDTAELIIQACEAIVEAHSLGIVHRDLKPANLFCVQHADGLPSIKVLDFGISKTAGQMGDMTSTQSMLGSPLYMSPEQMHSSKSVDPRTDLWSLGVIMYECVTGILPTNSESFAELVYKVVNEDAPRLNERFSDIPDEFADVVHRCLARSRDARYTHVGELAMALLPFASERAEGSVDRIMRIAETSDLTKANAPAPAGSAPKIPAATGSTPTSTMVMSDTGKRPGLFGGAARRSGGHARASAKISAPVAEPMPVPAANAESLKSTKGEWSASTDGAASNGRMKLAVIATFVFTALVATIGFLLARQPPQPTGSNPPPVPTETATHSPSSAPAASSVAAAPSEAPSSEPAPPTSAVASASASVHPIDVAVPVPIPAPIPNPGVRPVVSAKPAVNCNPPYTLDAEGNKVFKKECI